MVDQGRVRLEDQLGNAEADAASDLGRRHQSELLMDARRSLLSARTQWYPIMQQLHRFMVAVSRVAVNMMGKEVLLLIRWSGTMGLGTLHWLVDAVDMGHFGSFFLEILILYEQRAGHRLRSEKVTRPHACSA